MLKILMPIKIAVDLCQKNTSKLTDCVLIWKCLREELFSTNLLTSKERDSFTDRYNYCITRVHSAAFLLSPKMLLQKIALPQEEIENALQYYKNFTHKFMLTFYKFRGGIALFELNKSELKADAIESMTDSEWWISFRSVHMDVVTNEDLENTCQLTK